MGTVLVTNDPAPDFSVEMLAQFGPVTMDWDEAIGDLTLTFENDLTDAQQQNVVYIVQHTANERSLRQNAIAAWQGNKDYIAIADAATAAQVRAQVKRLTQQNNALIRLVMEQYDGTD